MKKNPLLAKLPTSPSAYGEPNTLPGERSDVELDAATDIGRHEIATALSGAVRALGFGGQTGIDSNALDILEE